MKHCTNASKRCWWNGKQCRPWSDCFWRSSLILVWTVCRDLSVPIHRICMVTRFHCTLPFIIKYLLSPFDWNAIDGQMTFDFTSFSTVFQSYQDDGRMIMKGCVQWNPVCNRKDFHLERGSNLGSYISRSALKDTVFWLYEKVGLHNHFQ